MDKDLRALYNAAMSNLMLRVCKDHVYKDMIFFSEEEFKTHQVNIFTITTAYRNLEKKLKTKN